MNKFDMGILIKIQNQGSKFQLNIDPVSKSTCFLW